MNKIEFSKRNSMALKGIAIVMMLFHHCFRNATLFKGFEVSFWPLSQDQAIRLCLFFKICVSIYAFVTGYGLMLSFNKCEKGNYNGKEIGKWTINRIIKTLSGFWIIVLFTMISAQILNGRTGAVFFKNTTVTKGIFDIIMNFTGLAYLFNIPLLNGTWWYMSIAILFIISIPLLVKLIKKYGYTITGILIIALPRLIRLKFNTNSYFAFLFIVFLGATCADKNLIVKFANFKIIKKNNIVNKILKFVIETLIVVLLYKIYSDLPINLYWEISFGLIPLFLIMYVYEFFIDIPGLKHVLEFLGKHSMNIFLVHTLLRAIYLHNFIYSKGHFMLTVLILLAVSLLISIGIELFKKIVRYEKLIDFMQRKIECKNDAKN